MGQVSSSEPSSSAAAARTLPPSTPVTALAGVGETRARHLADLGVNTLGELLEYFPRTYQFESEERAINQLASGPIQTARGKVVAVDYIPVRPRPRFEATLDDGTGILACAWFNGAYLRRAIHPGLTIRVKGKVGSFRSLPQMTNPKWWAIDENAELVTDSQFRPIYPATAKLTSEAIQRIVDANLEAALGNIEEWFADALLKQRGLLDRREAYRLIHRPSSMRQALQARRRIVYDELMLMQLGLGISKQLRDGRFTAPVMRIDKLLDQRIRSRFPFELTEAQTGAIWEIVKDLQAPRPMNRLLQGDVGSGKTVVAVYAMLTAVANRMQAALLAPTEVLAEQHYLTLSRLLGDSSVSVELYTGRTKRESKGSIMRALADGKVHIAVGTQALISEDVEFANLGLVVVDEQHKLGVRQRAVLKEKGLSPHYLVMTATPIPRTLALSYFADFDVSTIDSLPPGRQPIKTRWVTNQQAATAYAFARKQVETGRQGYIVLPQIDDTGLESAKSVKKEFEKLSKDALAGLRLSMLHGRMTTEEKHATMTAFRDGQIDVLIATTVIEVGIDVPNATVMIIENADQFGLSQLHQLRGRVGRGSELSYCILIGDAQGEIAKERLAVMTRTNNGFEIAEQDLQHRGPGEFFGTRQHGLPEFKLADITQEMQLLQQAKEDALALLADDARLKKPENAKLRAALIEMFGQSLPLAQVG
ncbi:MAG TPA: ATP-dependent DNA helicase RecG [Tepidisphaeraceae bacterium]|jgi:ATP-dependent DNA helicase RecG